MALITNLIRSIGERYEILRIINGCTYIHDTKAIINAPTTPCELIQVSDQMDKVLTSLFLPRSIYAQTWIMTL